MSEQVPFFGLHREFEEIRDETMAAVEEVLLSGHLLQGPAVHAFEEEVAARAGRRHAIAVNSCTDAIFFALHALGVGPGDEVLVPDYSFAASVSAVLRTGATPVFVDIDDTYSLDLELAAEAVTPQTRALLWVHLFGRMGDVAPVEVFAERHGIAVVEDAAQTFGGERDGRAAGSLGQASAYSFDPTKVIGAPGSGGVALTDDDGLAAELRGLRIHGKTATGEFAQLGYNSQLATLVAATLLVKLRHEEAWLRRRREIARLYCEALDGLAVVPELGTDREHIAHKFVFRTTGRDALRAALSALDVSTMIHYPYRLHELPFVAARPHRVVDAGRADVARKHSLSLPIHPYLRDEELERIVTGIAAFKATNPTAAPGPGLVAATV